MLDYSGLRKSVQDAGSASLEGQIAGQKMRQSNIELALRQSQSQRADIANNIQVIKMVKDTYGPEMARLRKKGDVDGLNNLVASINSNPNLKPALDAFGFSGLEFGKVGGKVTSKLPIKITEENIKSMPKGANVQVGDTGKGELDSDGNILSFEKTDVSEFGDVSERNKLEADARLKAGLRELDTLKGLATSATIPSKERQEYLDQLTTKKDQLLSEYVNTLTKQSQNQSTASGNNNMQMLVNAALDAGDIESELQYLDSIRDQIIEKGVDPDELKRLIIEASNFSERLDMPSNVPSIESGQIGGSQMMLPDQVARSGNART